MRRLPGLLVGLLLLSCSESWWEVATSVSAGRDESGGVVIACAYLEREVYTNPFLENDITQPGPASGVERCLLVFLNAAGDTLLDHSWSDDGWTGCPVEAGSSVTRLADGSFVVNGKPLGADGRPEDLPYRILSISPHGRYRIVAGGGSGEHRLMLPERTIFLGGYAPADWSPSGDTLCRGNHLFRLHPQRMDTLLTYDARWTCLSWGPGPDSLTFGVQDQNFLLIADLAGNVGDTLRPQGGTDLKWLRDTSWYIVQGEQGGAVYDRNGRPVLNGGSFCKQ